MSLRIEHPGSFDGLRDEWNALAAASGNVFATWEWATVWWRHYGGGRTLLLTTCRDADGRLVAVLPLYLAAARPLRVVRLLGHDPGDQLGPICLPPDREAVAGCLRRALVELEADLFLGERLLADEGWSVLLGARVLAREPFPVLALTASSWDELLAGWGRNLRANIRQYERKLEREHAARYRLEPVADLDTVFALHRARFGSTAYVEGDAPFHRDFAAVAHEQGWLRVWTLEADGRAVAALHGFRYAGVDLFYQAGRDPSWRGPSVGVALLAHTIRVALEEGVREYRFLRGGEAYKYGFATHDPGLETIGIAHGPLAVATLAAGAHMPRGATRRVRAVLAGR
jgi:CelD/BcsL family acetyltransferase involved in cellulose biosynthesis